MPIYCVVHASRSGQVYPSMNKRGRPASEIGNWLGIYHLPWPKVSISITNNHASTWRWYGFLYESRLVSINAEAIDPDTTRKQIHPSKRISARNDFAQREIRPRKLVVLRGHRVVGYVLDWDSDWNSHSQYPRTGWLWIPRGGWE